MEDEYFTVDGCPMKKRKLTACEGEDEVNGEADGEFDYSNSAPTSADPTDPTSTDEDDDIDDDDDESEEEDINDQLQDMPLPDDEVDELLDDYLEKKKNRKLAATPSHIEKTKKVMKKRGQDYFEVLPEGWIEVTHFSGMPLYLHSQSRVCTFSKPYYLGTGSVRKHEVPVSAIPCLQYRREIERERKDQSESHQTNDQVPNGKNTTEQNCNGSSSDLACAINQEQKQQDQDMNVDIKPLIKVEETNCASLANHESTQPPSKENSTAVCENYDSTNATSVVGVKKEEARSEFQAKVETVQDHKREKCITPNDVKDYCERLFEFDVIKIRKFKTWADRRKHNSILREQRQRPFLPNDTRLITCSSTNSGAFSSGKKEFVMNPAGKSFVCILHEFVQHQEKVQPRYIYKELENANTPYSATVVIKDTTYGVGFGNSKRQAKSEAAKKTIEILIPGIRDFTEAGTSRSGQIDSSQDLKFFDNIKIEDSRVSELCAKAGQQSPYQILVECLKRNAGTCNGDLPITHDVKLIKPQKNVYTMIVNGHEAKVTCKNKREGKQKAAQVILQKLHPQVTSWGGLLLMYGRGSCKTPKEKKEHEQKITELQSTASPNKPNWAILNKLKEEMQKLKY